MKLNPFVKRQMTYVGYGAILETDIEVKTCVVSMEFPATVNSTTPQCHSGAANEHKLIQDTKLENEYGR